MDAIRAIQSARDELLWQVESVFEKLMEQAIKSGETTEVIKEKREKDFEREYRLASAPAIFKGKKPTMIIINGEQVYVSTWKMVINEIMRRCNADPEKHVELMNLRGKITGKKRVILSKDKSDMRGPIKIDENLYLEAHYDTEALLRVVLTRVLDAVGYDYNGIIVRTRID